jgi:hypothetical protein
MNKGFHSQNAGSLASCDSNVVCPSREEEGDFPNFAWRLAMEMREYSSSSDGEDLGSSRGSAAAASSEEEEQ